ncbi:MAG: ferredoxin-NADP reductase [Clostridiales bacterium GWF2_38_85]|nr:MAG: ferredoxin-NADP reductase [Clostridiales bacterium GWF2_38_85]HBL84413.1 sulfide/dihydroorotate dehydrogenase-like FAD/NAD-binding protein [Clostridiales bacterium]
MTRIVKKRFLNDSIVEVVFDAPDIAKKAMPGQFIIFRVDEEGERIPLTIAGYDREMGTITVIAQTVGYSTKKLAAKEEGEYISDLVGPLGRPSELESNIKVAVIGGGLGCAIAYPQAKALHDMNCEVDIIAGFRSNDLIILEDEMKAVSDKLIICTDDGSNGNKALVTDALKALIENGVKYDLVIAIGPPIMMKFVCLLTKQYNIKTIVSLNPIMIDGTGMCGGCRVTVGGKIKFACVDGPDFDGYEVDFDELMRRNRAYSGDEKKRDEDCKLFQGVDIK